jgi:NDP-sugar pyrophosphorylase family protein
MMSLKEKAGCDGVVAVNREPNAGYIRRNFTVYLDGDSRITAVREKPEKVDTDLKGCGIYLFGEGLFEAIKRTPKNGKRGELELTSSIQVMIDSGASILAGEGVRGDVNITDPVDLLVSNLRALESEGKDSLVGRNASIHPGARIEKSVIGNDVTIRAPICIRQCVVMDGVSYEDTEDIERAVVMKDYILQDRGPGRGRAG